MALNRGMPCKKGEQNYAEALNALAGAALMIYYRFIC